MRIHSRKILLKAQDQMAWVGAMNDIRGMPSGVTDITVQGSGFFSDEIWM